jgi:hypothetical protein
MAVTLFKTRVSERRFHGKGGVCWQLPGHSVVVQSTSEGADGEDFNLVPKQAPKQARRSVPHGRPSS